MEDSHDRNTVEDFPNRPLKKAKYAESSALDDSLASPNISKPSMVSECSESIGSESSDPLQSPPSPTMLTLSPFSELMNEETISTDDDKQPEANNITYDFLPQGKIVTFLFLHEVKLEYTEYACFIFLTCCRLYIDRTRSLCSLCYTILFGRRYLGANR